MAEVYRHGDYYCAGCGADLLAMLPPLSLLPGKTLTGMRAPCQKCGALNLVGELPPSALRRWSSASVSSMTGAELRRLELAARALQEGIISPADFVEAVTTIAPRPVLKRLKRTRGWQEANWLAVAGIIVALIAAVPGYLALLDDDEASIPVGDVIEMIDRLNETDPP